MLYLILLALFTVLLTSKPASALTPDWAPRPDLKPYEKAEAIGGYDEATMLRIARWL